MKRITDYCVDCGLPCKGSSCIHNNATVYECDICHEPPAKYRLANSDYCDECAEIYLSEIFTQLTREEQADRLDVELEDINDYYSC